MSRTPIQEVFQSLAVVREKMLQISPELMWEDTFQQIL